MITEVLAGGVQMVQQTIQDQGTFGEYIRAVLRSKALTQFGVLMLFGLIGIIANWLAKWMFDQIEGSLFDYLFRHYPKRTASAFAVFTAYALFTAVTSLDGAGWSIVVNLGLTTGFAIDALVNKAKRAVWTEDERKAHTSLPVSRGDDSEIR